jgi:hypothetical protein
VLGVGADGVVGFVNEGGGNSEDTMAGTALLGAATAAIWGYPSYVLYDGLTSSLPDDATSILLSGDPALYNLMANGIEEVPEVLFDAGDALFSEVTAAIESDVAVEAIMDMAFFLL